MSTEPTCLRPGSVRSRPDPAGGPRRSGARRAGRATRGGPGQRGSAVVTWVLVAVPVLALVLAVLQGIAYLRAREVVAAAAAEGARWAAAADRPTRDGGPVAERRLGRFDVRCTAAEQDGAVVVRCAGTVAALLPGSRLRVSATARAHDEDR